MVQFGPDPPNPTLFWYSFILHKVIFYGNLGLQILEICYNEYMLDTLKKNSKLFSPNWLTKKDSVSNIQTELQVTHRLLVRQQDLPLLGGKGRNETIGGRSNKRVGDMRKGNVLSETLEMRTRSHQCAPCH